MSQVLAMHGEINLPSWHCTFSRALAEMQLPRCRVFQLPHKPLDWAAVWEEEAPATVSHRMHRLVCPGSSVQAGYVTT